MAGWLKRELAVARDALRILSGRQFWASFHDYWFGEGLQVRLDDWVSRVRENTGQPPDEVVEARRRERAARAAQSDRRSG